MFSQLSNLARGLSLSRGANNSATRPASTTVSTPPTTPAGPPSASSTPEEVVAQHHSSSGSDTNGETPETLGVPSTPPLTPSSAADTPPKRPSARAPGAKKRSKSPPGTLPPLVEGEAGRMIPFPDLKPSEPRIGMSACLLGHNVRYNGNHCHAKSLTDRLGILYKFVPVCPEMDIGLGTPRPTLRLVGDGRDLNHKDLDMEDLGKAVRMICPDNEADYTDTMVAYSKAKVEDLRSFGCDGFVLKKDSPSCGYVGVKVYVSRTSVNSRSLYKGLFARTIAAEWPELPVSDEGRLMDDEFRDNFVQQVMCHHTWRTLDGSFKSVVQFHETHKFVLLAQDPAALKDLGRFLAKGKAHFLANNGRAMYYRRFFMALKVLVGRGRHVNVLRRLCGYIKREADPAIYASLQSAITDYAEGLVPLVMPLTLLQVIAGTIPAHHRKHAVLARCQYTKSAPRTLKANTSISSRTVSALPPSVRNAGI